MNIRKCYTWIRATILTGILLFVTYESYLHQIIGSGKSASAHALCPFGALESLYALLFEGYFIKKIYWGTMILFLLTVFITVLFRKSFCGLLCPFGWIQEIFGRLGQKMLKKQFVIPQSLDKPLRLLKYVVLILTVGAAWYTGTLWMSQFDPYYAYSHITNIFGSVSENPLAIIGFVLLGVTIVGSLIYNRFFCKYLCPAGAFFGIIGKISPTQIRRNDKLCIHCKVCNKVCPVNIDIENQINITSMECIGCNQCVVSCPKSQALEVNMVKKSLNPIVLLVIVIIVFFGTLAIAQVTGNFEVLPSSGKSDQIIPISDVKGSYTIEQSADLTGLSLEGVYYKLNIPESVPKSTKLKDISIKVPGYSLDRSKQDAETK